MIDIRKSLTALAVAGVIAVAPAAIAYADGPAAGDSCTKQKVGQQVDVDGLVLECQKVSRTPKVYEWVDVTPEAEEEESTEEETEDEGGAEEEATEEEDQEEGTAEEEGTEDEDAAEETEEDGEAEEETGLDCVNLNTASVEELQFLRHVGPDRAAQIVALRPITHLDQLDAVNGLRAGGPRLAELIAGGDGWLPVCDISDENGEDSDNGGGTAEGDADEAEEADERKPSDDASGGLPVTGAALAGVVAAGVAALGGGGTAMYLSRRRRNAATTTSGAEE